MATAHRSKQVEIALVVIAYFIVSITMVFINKLLLDSATSFPAPFFITWFQCVCTMAICWACGEAGRATSGDSFFRQFPVFTYKLDVARKLLPLSIIFVGMVAFNNLCLQYVEVSFYNVARSLTIVFNVMFTFYFLGESTSTAVIASLATVVTGFFVGSSSEINFSLLGTAFGVASSLFVSLNSIYTKKMMPIVDNNQWTLAAYNNMNAVIMFVPFVLYFEGGLLLENAHKMLSSQYWALMLLSGVFGFLIGIVTIMQIKVTSPLSHNISGTAKACVQTVLALLIWRNPTTLTNLLGVALVLLGSFGYAYIRNLEMEAANAAKQAALREKVASSVDADSGSLLSKEGDDNGAIIIPLPSPEDKQDKA